MEDTIAAVWASVLRMDTATAATAITRDSDFFDLGGHSLLLVKVAAGLQSGTGLEVSVVCLYQLTSILRSHTACSTYTWA
jgi:acyl carrier protein